MRPHGLVVEQAILPVHTHFDSVPFANNSLVDVARILDIETAKAKPNRNTLAKLMGRVLGGLGHALIAMEGRPAGTRLVKLLNRSFARVLARLPEFAADLAETNRYLSSVHAVLARLPLKRETLLPPPSVDHPLDEKLVLANYTEYASLVADAYDARPIHDPAAKASYKVLLDHAKKMFRQLLSRIRIEFVNEPEPYKDAADMTARVNAEGVMYVSTLFSENLASGWSERENWIFRAVHDYIVHIGGHHDFSLRGEIGTYNRHAKIVPPAALPALFSEVVGQVAYAIVRGRFPSPQKACVLYGFDYRAVGRVNPGEYERNFTA
jgi:hypothetical protein